MSAKTEAVAELKQAVDALEAVSDSLAGLDVPELGDLVSFADRRVAEAIRLLTKQ
jgi:hypothetical protein